MDSNSASRGQNSAVQAPEVFLENFCTELLRCQKSINLYPREHPRVSVTLSELQTTLFLRHQVTGAVFSLETEEIEDLAERDITPAGRVYAYLGQLLKLHIIEKITLYPEVTEDELYELCGLLQKDLLKFIDENASARFDPGEWENIHVSFYTPQDFPEDLPRGDSLLERAAGLHRSDKLQKLLNELAPETAKQVGDALVKPAFLKRICEIRRELNKCLPVATRKSGKQVDLIGTTIQSVTAEVEGKAEGAPSEMILKAINSVIDFVEKNVDSLASAINDDPSFDSASALSRCLQENEALGKPVFDRLASFQAEKARLAKLFQTSIEFGDSGNLSIDNPSRERADRTFVSRENARIQGAEDSLQREIDAIKCDKDILRRELEEHDERRQYLHIVLELLAHPKMNSDVRKNWSPIVSHLARSEDSEDDGDFLGLAVEDIARFSKENNPVNGEDLLSAVIENVDSVVEIQHLFEDTIVERGGRPFAARCLNRVSQRHPQRAIQLLTKIHRNEDSPLRDDAEANLLAMSKNPKLLESWARADPQRLLQRETFKRIVEESPTEHLMEAFTNFFTHTPVDQCLRLLRSVKPDTAGSGHILYAAIQYGHSVVGDFALRFLAKHPSDAVVRSLIQTVRLNNYQDRPSMPAIESALAGLMRIEQKRAQEFLDEVLTSRNWLRYEFRKEIRDALTEMLDCGGTSNVSGH